MPFWAIQNTKDLSILADLVAQGKLKVVKEKVVPFDKAPQAWATSIEGHVVGKVVVKL